MNHCDRVDSLLSAYLEGEASPSETRFVDGHLTHCPRCRAQLGEMRSLLTTLTRMPRVEVGSDFTARVLARTTGTEPAGLEEPVLVPLPTSRAAWTVPLAAAAALAVVLFATSRLAPGPGIDAPPVASNAIQTTLPRPDIAPVPSLPQVEELTEYYPSLREEEGQVESIGTARDAYVLEAYELRSPVGGGTPVVTRVSAGSEDKVVVTF